MPAGVPSKLYSSAPLDSASAYREPQVAYSAELTVATREFAHSRASLEEILEHHHGYVAKLRMVGEPTGSILSATLRVPSSEYRSALNARRARGIAGTLERLGTLERWRQSRALGETRTGTEQQCGRCHQHETHDRAYEHLLMGLSLARRMRWGI